jgi:hypothetical protein
MPLDLLMEQIDPEACHLKNFPKRLWVFGGACDNSNDPKSLRDSFWKRTLEPTTSKQWLLELQRPEEYNDWLEFSGYDDLITFERDACYLARGTILFAESPGSLAELGALAIDDAILHKLFVVVQSKYLEQEERKSFLNLGPLKRARKHNGLCVIDPPSEKELMDIDFETIIDSIDFWLPTTHKSSALNNADPTHKLLLLADIVDLLLVSKLTELKKVINFFNVKMSDGEILRALALLDFFNFVKLKERGNNEKFWVGHAHSDAPWIDYKAKPGSRFDRSRFKTVCNELINKDPRRRALLERSR